MEYFNHYTLNTDDNRKSIPAEVGKGIYFVLASKLSDARRNGKAEILDGTYMELTEEGSTYAITLFKEINENKIPLLLTCGCKNKSDAAKTIKTVNEVYKEVYGKNPMVFPIAPFCIDVILPSIIVAPEITEWTGDFCKCMAWAILAPEMIR